jgi:hypothetical protein
MDAEYALLKAATIEALIPQDGSTPLSELLHSEDVLAESVTRILEIKRRDLLFIGTSMPTTNPAYSYS